MNGLTPNQHAAFSTMAATIAAVVTNSLIVQFAAPYGLTPEGSNKAEKLRGLFMDLWLDGRRRVHLEVFVATLTMEGHARSLQGKDPLYIEDVDSIVAALKALGFSANGLAKGTWRNSAKRRTPIQAPAVPQPAPRSSPPKTAVRHDYRDALALVAEQLSPAMSPQARGRQLEVIVMGILQNESLSPVRRVVNSGEEIDLTCVVDNHHYLIEIKWLKDPVGLPVLRDFAAKVDTKALGTFGIVLSMSGYVQDINEKASRGRQLSCVGFGSSHLMNILEARTTWAQEVRRARLRASHSSTFFAEAV